MPSIHCRGCGDVLEVPQSYAGRVRCRRCMRVAEVLALAAPRPQPIATSPLPPAPRAAPAPASGPVAVPVGAAAAGSLPRWFWSFVLGCALATAGAAYVIVRPPRAAIDAASTRAGIVALTTTAPVSATPAVVTTAPSAAPGAGVPWVAPAPASERTAAAVEELRRLSEEVRELRGQLGRVPAAPTAPPPKAPHGRQGTLVFQFADVAVVKVTARRGDVSRQGSGFAISSDGLLATAHHVIDGADAVAVEIDGRRVPAWGLVAADPDSDLAVLDLGPAVTLLPLTLVNEPATEVLGGANVWAAGYPLGGRLTCAPGALTASPMDSWQLQFSAPSGHGCSGGPLMIEDGSVIGVIVSGRDDGQLINFATSSARLTALLERRHAVEPFPIAGAAVRPRAKAR